MTDSVIPRLYNGLLSETMDFYAHPMHLSQGIKVDPRCPKCNPDGYEQVREAVYKFEAWERNHRPHDCPSCECNPTEEYPG